MGVPMRSSSSEQQPSSSSQTDPKPSPDSLPPEALDLASRLFTYARSGDTSNLHSYVAAGIPANLTDSAGNTLLMLAAYHGHADTVRMLQERGADPNALNDRGQSPLAGAVFKGWEEVVRVLVDGGADPFVGHPNARDSAVMFRNERWIEVFDEMAMARSNGSGVDEYSARR